MTGLRGVQVFDLWSTHGVPFEVSLHLLDQGGHVVHEWGSFFRAATAEGWSWDSIVAKLRPAVRDVGLDWDVLVKQAWCEAVVELREAQ